MNKIQKSNNRGISNIIAYVLLITLTVSLSAVVYNYLKLFAQEDSLPECPSGTSISIRKYNCDYGSKFIAIEVENKGRFNFEELNITMNNETDPISGIYGVENVFQLSNPNGDPILYLDFDGESTGGTINGSSFEKIGKTNGARKFDGIDDYISFENVKPKREISISAWANKNDWSKFDKNETIISNTEGGGYALNFNDEVTGNVNFWIKVKDNSNYLVPSSSYTSLSSGWHHFVATFDGKYARLYVDGIKKSEIENSVYADIDYSTVTNSFFIGAEPGSGKLVTQNTYFNGLIDEVKIFNYALDANEVSNLTKYGYTHSSKINLDTGSEIIGLDATASKIFGFDFSKLNQLTLVQVSPKVNRSICPTSEIMGNPICW